MKPDLFGGGDHARLRLAPTLVGWIGLLRARGTLVVYSLVFAVALSVVAADLYSALVVAVMLTTFVAPPWLKALYRART